MCVCVCVYVCVCVNVIVYIYIPSLYIYIYIKTHTHTHTHTQLCEDIYIYIYIYREREREREREKERQAEKKISTKKKTENNREGKKMEIEEMKNGERNIKEEKGCLLLREREGGARTEKEKGGLSEVFIEYIRKRMRQIERKCSEIQNEGKKTPKKNKT